jgi:hypothetical protein
VKAWLFQLTVKLPVLLPEFSTSSTIDLSGF